MSKGGIGLRWVSSQHMREIGSQLEALQREAREGSERNQTASEEIRALQSRSEEDAAEIKKLKSTVARLEKQLAWMSEEAQKTGTALFERIEALRKT